jgi:hypothetical protein
LRRYRGWEPKRRTTVTEWTEDGRPAQWVTETEPEFDTIERQGWEQLDEYRGALCRSCGNLKSVCSDPTTPWYPQRTVCWSKATTENISRRWTKKHEKAKPDALGFLPTDGTSLWVSTHDLTSDDHFL